MEITLGQVYASYNLLNRIVDQQLPIRMAFRFTRLIRELNKEWQSLEKFRDGLIKKHGEEVEGQEGSFKVAEENREEFFKEFQELLGEMVEVEWELVSIDDPALNALQLSVRELNILGWLFTEFKQMADEAAAEVAADAIEGEMEKNAEADAEAPAEAEAEAPAEEPAEVG